MERYRWNFVFLIIRGAYQWFVICGISNKVSGPADQTRVIRFSYICTIIATEYAAMFTCWYGNIITGHFVDYLG